MDYTLDLIKKTDAAGMYEIEKASFKTPWSYESMLEEAGNPLARYYVAHSGGEVIGYAGAWLVIDEAHVTNVAVRQDFRGKGIGRALMERLIQLCADSGMTKMSLEVRMSNAAAQNLYRSLGFTADGVRKKYYENTEDALLMSKSDMPEGDPDNDPFIIYEP